MAKEKGKRGDLQERSVVWIPSDAARARPKPVARVDLVDELEGTGKGCEHT